MPTDDADFEDLKQDPVTRLLLEGQAQTMAEAEEMYLNEVCPKSSRYCRVLARMRNWAGIPCW